MSDRPRLTIREHGPIDDDRFLDLLAEVLLEYERIQTETNQDTADDRKTNKKAAASGQ